MKAERRIRSWLTISLARHDGKSVQACSYLRAFALSVLCVCLGCSSPRYSRGPHTSARHPSDVCLNVRPSQQPSLTPSPHIPNTTSTVIISRDNGSANIIFPLLWLPFWKGVIHQASHIVLCRGEECHDATGPVSWLRV